MAIEAGAHIIIARGLQAKLIKKYTNIPLVEMRLHTQEIGLLIKKAKAIVKKELPRVGLIVFENMLCNTSHLEELFCVRLFIIYLDKMEDTAQKLRSNGEFYAIEEDEMERGLRIILEQTAQRVPVYFGMGAISTKKCVRMAKMAVKNNADGISILQPMFLKPTEDELFLHFKTIANTIPETPVLLYNNSGRVGYTMTANLVDRLAHEVNNIVGIKDTRLFSPQPLISFFYNRNYCVFLMFLL